MKKTKVLLYNSILELEETCHVKKCLIKPVNYETVRHIFSIMWSDP